MTRSDDSFLARWSRRKASARAAKENDAVAQAHRDEPPPDDQDAKLQDAQHKDAQHKDDGPQAEMPQTSRSNEGQDGPASADAFAEFNFESLTFESDYQQFMAKGVPEAIRNKALRKLWLSHPVLANIDGLDDYCEDFSDAVWATPDIKTAYRVGKGFLTDEEVEAWERLGQTSPSEPAQEHAEHLDAQPAAEHIEDTVISTEQTEPADDHDGSSDATTENASMAPANPPVEKA